MSATPDEIRKRIGDRVVVASISGGKDSAAMSLHLRELGIEHQRVFMDTGWEHEKTYEYLRGELTRVLGPITEIRGPMLMEELVRSKGMFPSRQRRYCTEELKVKPMIRYLNALEGEHVNTVGIRADESKRRGLLQEWEWQDGFDCEVYRPILSWTLDDVVAIHRRHGLAPNPLYLEGFQRVGCWPCIMSRKDEIRMIADKDPGRIRRLRVLEEDVGEATLARWNRDRAMWLWPTPLRPPPSLDKAGASVRLAGWEAERARLFERPFTRSSWFQAPTRRFGTMPIHEVVQWSRTSRGGRQWELFAPGPNEDGCMRWGMCETSSPVDDSDA